MGSITELIKTQDRRAANITEYTHQESNLWELSCSFPSFKEKPFSHWIREAGSSGSAQMVEFGGGARQVAAREILRTVPGINRYVGYEIKSLEGEAQEELAAYPSYTSIQGGLADFDPRYIGSNFDIAFAHNVAEHLVHPFLLARKLYHSVRPGGLVFVNGIHLDKVIAKELQSWWRQRGYEYKCKFGSTETLLEMSGFTRMNIAFRRNSDSFVFPILTDTPIQDHSGVARANRIYEFPKPLQLSGRSA